MYLTEYSDLVNLLILSLAASGLLSNTFWNNNVITIFSSYRILFLFNLFPHLLSHLFFPVLSQNFEAWFCLFEHVKHSFYHLYLIIPLSEVLCMHFCSLWFLYVSSSCCLIPLRNWLSLIMWWALYLIVIYRNIFKPRIMLFFSWCLLLPDTWDIYTLNSFQSISE